MTTIKDMEDSLKNYIIQEQSDAHNRTNLNITKYNNIKISMNSKKNSTPHVIIRISISEAIFSLKDFSKINGGLGHEEKYVNKWFGRYGIKERLIELWGLSEGANED